MGNIDGRLRKALEPLELDLIEQNGQHDGDREAEQNNKKVKQQRISDSLVK